MRMAVHVVVRNYKYKRRVELIRPMKECKEGAYVIGNTLVKGTEKDEIWPYSELSIHKTLNMVNLHNRPVNRIEQGE